MPQLNIVNIIRDKNILKSTYYSSTIVLEELSGDDCLCGRSPEFIEKLTISPFLMKHIKTKSAAFIFI